MSDRLREILQDLGDAAFGERLVKVTGLPPWLEVRARRVYEEAKAARMSENFTGSTNVSLLDRPDVPEEIRYKADDLAQELAILAYIEGLADGKALAGSGR